MRKDAMLLLWLGVGGCATAPAYRPAAVQVPPAFRELTRDSASAGRSRAIRQLPNAPASRARGGTGCCFKV